MISPHHVTPDSNADADTPREPVEGFGPATMPILAQHWFGFTPKPLAPLTSAVDTTDASTWQPDATGRSTGLHAIFRYGLWRVWGCTRHLQSWMGGIKPETANGGLMDFVWLVFDHTDEHRFAYPSLGWL